MAKAALGSQGGATVAMGLLRNEYITRGIAPVPDGVIVEIVDKVYLPLVRGNGRGRAGRGAG